MLTIEHRPRAPIGTFVLLGVAGLLYALMLAGLVGAPYSDPAGRGLAQAFAALIGLLLWIVLAVLLVIGAVRGRMPLLGSMAAAILLPASAVGAFAASELYDRQVTWPIMVLALLPPVFALYALWARMPQFHVHLEPLPTSIFAGVVVLAMTALPLAAKWQQSQPDPVRAAQRAAEQSARQREEEKAMEQARARDTARFASLGPDSSLASYLGYLHGDHEQDALVGIRLVKRRQVDAITLLRQGRIGDLARLREFNVDPTPALCTAYRDALGAAAAQVSPQVRSDYLSAAMDLERQLPNIRWLAGAHCDLSTSLDTLERNVRAVADSPRMTAFADTLAKLGASN